ncbi:MAG: putative antibiotic hydrolase, partial [Actinomycetia bacterium]|nr:putative antibiotic hydrolase [Actinomycetes bacterium]
MRRRVWRTLALAGLVVAGSVTSAGAAASGTVTEVSVITPDSTPIGLTAGASGSVWFAEHAGSSLGRVDSTGKVTEFAVGANSQSKLGVPDAMATGSDGTLWFTDASSIVPRVGKVNPTTG